MARILCLLYSVRTHSPRPSGSCPGLVTFLLSSQIPFSSWSCPPWSLSPSCVLKCLTNEAAFQLLATMSHSSQRNPAHRKTMNWMMLLFKNNPLERAKGPRSGWIPVFITPLSGDLLSPVKSNEALLIITKKKKKGRSKMCELGKFLNCSLFFFFKKREGAFHTRHI